MAVRQQTPEPVDPPEPARSIAPYMMVRDLSAATWPELDEMIAFVERMPPGVARSVLLRRLTWLAERRQPQQALKREPSGLARGVENLVDSAVYGLFFAGPAFFISLYQTALRVIGKYPEDSFPHGTWQFYVNYALREDTARHANETHGFDSFLASSGQPLAHAERVSAWVMTAIHCLHQYPALLANEWRERMLTAILAEVASDHPAAERFAALYQQWGALRPYRLGPGALPAEPYHRYRRRAFNRFLKPYLLELDPAARAAWAQRVAAAKHESLPSYLAQMSIVAYMEPGLYGETSQPLALADVHVGVIAAGRYYLIPASVAGQPADLAAVRAQVAAILAADPAEPAADLAAAATVKRASFARQRPRLSPDLRGELDRLRQAPILINADLRPAGMALSELRQTERGLGEHALTIFDTGATIVFDQSHILFDGTWGAALADILTNEAIGWAQRIAAAGEPPVGAEAAPAPAPLRLALGEADLALFEGLPRVTAEVSSETVAVDLAAMQALRRHLHQNHSLYLTVNDLLVLYRAIHATTYRPDPALCSTLEALRDAEESQAAADALAALDPALRGNPTILIPVDVSHNNPRDRLHPMTFEVPLEDLGLLQLHARAVAGAQALEHAIEDDTSRVDEFAASLRQYLAALTAFGAHLHREKAITQSGGSKSANAIKLLAHLPARVQRILDSIPEWFDVLNDMIKGREVLSNIGAVVRGSSLMRFIAAKDDNEKKSLVWGILTDAQGVMHISLRDFRPHVAALLALGRRDLALWMVDDYLASYARGLNRHIAELQDLLQAALPLHATPVGA